MVTEITSIHYRDGKGEVREYGAKRVVLIPQYDSTIEEDRRYAQATPSGRIELYIDNPAALQYLQPGHLFYVDFTEASSQSRRATTRKRK